jgi:hypothetical protein
MPKSVLS